MKRRWVVDGESRHHLIDVVTGLPSDSDLNLVTVIAARAWASEVLAKAVLLRGSTHPFDVIGGTGAEAMAVDDDRGVHTTDGFAGFVIQGETKA